MRSVRLAAAAFWLGALVLAACAPKRVSAPVTEPPAPAVEAPGTPVTLRVGLAESQKRVVIVAQGPCALRVGVEARDVRTIAAGDTIGVERLGTQVRWMCADDSGTTPLVLVAPLTDEACLRWRDSAWRGRLLVLATPQDAGLTLIDELPLETYLRGVVPAEIGHVAATQLAAVEAQAVAARTYAVAHLGTRVSHGFDLFADVRDQVYRGVAGEDSLADAAIARTAHLVLTHDGVPIHAYYHATCGGCSDVPDAVWPRPAQPYFAVRQDGPGPGGQAYCAAAAHARWTETWTADQLTRILASTLPDYLDHMAAPDRAGWAGVTFTPAHRGDDGRHPGDLHDLRIVSRTHSGRVKCLDVVMDAGTYHVRGDRVRWVLSPASGLPAILRSAWFDLDLQRDAERPVRITARGRGYGHGVGMCQNGALARAAAGQDVRTILAQYYPGAKLQPLDAEDLP